MSWPYGGKTILHKERHIFQVPGEFPLKCVDHMNNGTRNNILHCICHCNDSGIFRHGSAVILNKNVRQGCFFFISEMISK